MRKKLLITISLILLSYSLHAQHYDYNFYSTKDGLPHNNILKVFQDSYGLIWLGTFKGLCSYDGDGFKVHNSIFGHENNSKTHTIGAIYEDSTKNIWAGSWSGRISCYIRRKQEFKTYSATKKSKINCFKSINSDIWIGFNDGSIGVINPIPDTISYHSICEEPILCISLYNDSVASIITGDKIYYYNFQSLSIEKVRNVMHNAIDLVENTSNQVYYIDWDGLGKMSIDRESKITTRRIKQDTKVFPYYCLTRSNNNKNFYYTDGKIVYEFDSLLKQKSSFHISDHITFNYEIVNSFIEDNTGVFWFGTKTGLYKLNKIKNQFTKYSTNNKKGAISNNYVRAIYCDDKNDIWVGFKHGSINRLVYDTVFSRYTLKTKHQYLTTDTIQSTNYTINCFLEFGKDLFAGGEVGLFIKKNDFFVSYQPALLGHISQIWSLHESANNLWIGTNKTGLYIWDKKKLHHYTIDNCELNSNNIWCIYKDNTGIVWLGTDDGLYYIDNTISIDQLKFNRVDIPTTSQFRVWGICSSKQDLYIGTTGNGLLKLNLTTKKIRPISSIKEDIISSVITDNNDNIWVATAKGLYKYYNDSVEYYSIKEGLVSSDFNFNAVAINNQGYMLFGTKSGMISYYPEKVTTSNILGDKKVLITSIEVAEKGVIKGVYDKSILSLKRLENDVRINYAFPNYSQSLIWYRYKLEHYQDYWTYVSKGQNEVIYPNLPPGDYNFKVQASLDKKKWSQSTNIGLSIKPALWQRPLFWLFIILLVLALVTYIIKKRFNSVIKRERTKAAFQKKVAELELTALQSQMNPHFVFNTINSIQHFIINHDVEEANEYLTQFAKLMRLFLESSKNKYIPLKNEITLLNFYLSLEKLRFENKLDYEIIIDDVLQKNKIEVPSLLLQPFVENAIKHGIVPKEGSGLIKIFFNHHKTKRNYIECVIDDNGIGRKASKARQKNQQNKHISRGLELIKDRIKTYNYIENQQITTNTFDKEHPKEGTIVAIETPYKLL